MGKWRFEFSENGLRGSVGQCWVRLGDSAWAGQVERVYRPLAARLAESDRGVQLRPAHETE